MPKFKIRVHERAIGTDLDRDKKLGVAESITDDDFKYANDSVVGAGFKYIEKRGGTYSYHHIWKYSNTYFVGCIAVSDSGVVTVQLKSTSTAGCDSPMSRLWVVRGRLGNCNIGAIAKDLVECVDTMDRGFNTLWYL